MSLKVKADCKQSNTAPSCASSCRSYVHIEARASDAVVARADGFVTM